IGRALEQRFLATDGIVDVDSSVEADAAREVLAIDRVRAARLGVSQADIADTIAAGLSGLDASHLIDGSSKYPRPIRLRLPVADVVGDERRGSASPLYGMFDLPGQLDEHAVAGQRLSQHYAAQPADTAGYAVKWDGEWQITSETFRDMGIAYAAGMVLIYLLVVAWFRNYAVPLVIMAPIPLTVIGVMPGHALLGMQFTATSMIGMIALAGIIVRNS